MIKTNNFTGWPNRYFDENKITDVLVCTRNMNRMKAQVCLDNPDLHNSDDLRATEPCSSTWLRFNTSESVITRALLLLPTSPSYRDTPVSQKYLISCWKQKHLRRCSTSPCRPSSAAQPQHTVHRTLSYSRPLRFNETYLYTIWRVVKKGYQKFNKHFLRIPLVDLIVAISFITAYVSVCMYTQLVLPF